LQGNYGVVEGDFLRVPVVIDREYPQVVFGFGNFISQQVSLANREYLERDHLVKDKV
jgi:hypothetical protein